MIFGDIPMSKQTYLVSLTCAALLASTTALAESENPYVKYREKGMSALSAHMAAAAQIVTGQVTLDKRLGGHAAALQHLLTDLPAQFPEGSDDIESVAKPEVWSARADFEKAAGAAQAKAEAFSAAVEGGDKAAIGAAFKELGDTCKACHQDFRSKR
jgi:cytochrome c556